MTWTNAFDTGPCTVSVENSIVELGRLFSGSLSKGQTSAQFAGVLTNEVLTVSVSATGDVAINWISGSGPSGNYVLGVAPSAVGATAARISGIVMPCGVSGLARAFYSGTAHMVLSSANSGVTWTPDPAVSSNRVDAGYLDVWMGALV